MSKQSSGVKAFRYTEKKFSKKYPCDYRYLTLETREPDEPMSIGSGPKKCPGCGKWSNGICSCGAYSYLWGDF